jgi:hypothetical protein
VKDDGEAVLADKGYAASLAEGLGAFGNEEMFAVVAPEVGGDHALDGTGEGAVEAVKENGLDESPLEEAVERSDGLIEGVLVGAEFAALVRRKILGW